MRRQGCVIATHSTVVAQREPRSPDFVGSLGWAIFLGTDQLTLQCETRAVRAEIREAKDRHIILIPSNEVRVAAPLLAQNLEHPLSSPSVSKLWKLRQRHRRPSPSTSCRTPRRVSTFEKDRVPGPCRKSGEVGDRSPGPSTVRPLRHAAPGTNPMTLQLKESPRF